MTFHESLLMSACFIFTYNRNTVKLGGAAKFDDGVTWLVTIIKK